jgi:RNA polymerase sigma factor (sigma-70 family)
MSAIVCVRKSRERSSIDNFTNGMTKREADRWIENNYDYLCSVAQAVINRDGRTYDAVDLISTVYLQVLKPKKLDRLETDDDLKRFITAMINRECYGVRSDVNKLFRTEYTPLNGIEQEDELFQPDSEMMYNHRKAVLISYRNNLKCSVKRTIFDAYFEKNHRTCRELGEYFNLHRDTAMQIIRELKTDIRNYEKIQK